VGDEDIAGANIFNPFLGVKKAAYSGLFIFRMLKASN